MIAVYKVLVTFIGPHDNPFPAPTPTPNILISMLQKKKKRFGQSARLGTLAPDAVMFPNHCSLCKKS